MDEREDTGVICAMVQNNENEFGFKKSQNRSNLFWKIAWDPHRKTERFLKWKKETGIPNRKFLGRPPIFWFTNKKIVL